MIATLLVTLYSVQVSARSRLTTTLTLCEQCATWYVGKAKQVKANCGTSRNPCGTDLLNLPYSLALVRPGDTIVLTGELRGKSVSIVGLSGRSKEKPVTITSETVLSRLKISASRFVTLSGIEVVRNQTQGISVSKSTHILLSRVTVAGKSDISVIYPRDTSGILVLDSTFVTIDSSIVSSVATCIRVTAMPMTDIRANNFVSNNKLYNCQEIPIEIETRSSKAIDNKYSTRFTGPLKKLDDIVVE